MDAESRQRPKKYQSSADDPAHAIPSRALWIGNLPSNTEAQFLLDLFSPYGVIESTRTVPSKNCGFCNFYTVADAVRARDALQGHRIGGTALRIGFGKAQALHGEDLIRAVTLEARQEKERREAEMRTHASAAAVAANEAYKTIAADSSAIIPAKRREGSRSITPSQQQEKTSTPITYLDTVPPLPYLLGAPPRDESEPYHKMTIAHLKDIRRKLEHSSGVSSLEIAGWIKECLPQIVELSTDLHGRPVCYVYNQLYPHNIPLGNTVIQKLIDRATDQQRLMLLQKAAPHLAAIAMHKVSRGNGRDASIIV